MAIKRRDHGAETVAEIGRSYNVAASFKSDEAPLAALIEGLIER